MRQLPADWIANYPVYKDRVFEITVLDLPWHPRLTLTITVR